MNDFLKRILKSIGLVVLYILVQCVVVTGVMFYFMYFDNDFMTALEEAMTQYSNVVNPASMRIMYRLLVPTMLLSDLLTTIPILIFSKKKNEKIIRKIEKNKFFIIILLSLGLNILMEFLLGFVPDDVMSSYTELMAVTENMSFFWQMIVIGILAPIVEELIFRYACIRPFKTYKPKVLKCKGETIGIIFSALMFGLAHGNIVQSTYAFIFGLLLAYVYTREYNLSESILMHMTINSSSTILVALTEPFSIIMEVGMIVCMIVSIVIIVKRKGLFYEQK